MPRSQRIFKKRKGGCGRKRKTPESVNTSGSDGYSTISLHYNSSVEFSTMQLTAAPKICEDASTSESREDQPGPSHEVLKEKDHMDKPDAFPLDWNTEEVFIKEEQDLSDHDMADDDNSMSASSVSGSDSQHNKLSEKQPETTSKSVVPESYPEQQGISVSLVHTGQSDGDTKRIDEKTPNGAQERDDILQEKEELEAVILHLQTKKLLLELENIAEERKRITFEKSNIALRQECLKLREKLNSSLLLSPAPRPMSELSSDVLSSSPAHSKGSASSTSTGSNSSVAGGKTRSPTLTTYPSALSKKFPRILPRVQPAARGNATRIVKDSDQTSTSNTSSPQPKVQYSSQDYVQARSAVSSPSSQSVPSGNQGRPLITILPAHPMQTVQDQFAHPMQMVQDQPAHHMQLVQDQLTHPLQMIQEKPAHPVRVVQNQPILMTPPGTSTSATTPMVKQEKPSEIVVKSEVSSNSNTSSESTYSDSPLLRNCLISLPGTADGCGGTTTFIISPADLSALLAGGVSNQQGPIVSGFGIPSQVVTEENSEPTTSQEDELHTKRRKLS